MRFTRFAGCIVVACIIAAQAGFVARGDDYPVRPVTLIAPWPPGGAVDTLCRILAAKLTNRLGKSVIVENRPGAGSVIGVAVVARAVPDGYTLVMAGSAALATSVTIYKKLPYDPTRDFAPLAFIARIPFVLVVHPSLPVHSVLELIELAKQTHAKILTNDFNLNKVAQLRGVEVLNINELANSLKPVVLPGEPMKVFIIKEGKEPNQGV